MQNRFYKISFLLGALAVALGAFGAHALRDLVTERTLQAYNTGVQYHFIHTLVLLFVVLYYNQNQSAWVKRAGWLFVAGMIFFSGSLYTLTFFKAAGMENFNWLGAVTLLGGVCFIAGWLSLFLAVLKPGKH
jgi:uncharacterized membrane protein YgdD (TMEM256/DUF423 family)